MRVFLFPDQRRSLTWFEFLIAFVCLQYIVEAYSTSISTGELLWRATTFLTALIIHFQIHKLPLLPVRKRPIDATIANTTEDETAESADATENESGATDSASHISQRFVVLLVLLLSFHAYRFVALQLELDSVAVLRANGADVTGTGMFGSVKSISGGKLNYTHAIHFKRMTHLQNLELTGRGIMDQNLLHLKGLTNLTELRLRDTIMITDGGLEHLKGLTSLKELNLFGTKVSDTGVANLQKALPNCKIIH